MKIRAFLISTISASFPLLLIPTPALAQDAPQCTLDQISEALNQLDCTVSGAFISPASLVQTITAACEPTSDEETCHACFRKSGGKVGPALKALVKVKILPKSSLSQFRIALVTAEETTCAAKQQPNDGEEDDDSYQPTPPENSRPDDSLDRGRGRGRGRGQDDTSPERPDRRRGF